MQKVIANYKKSEVEAFGKKDTIHKKKERIKVIEVLLPRALQIPKEVNTQERREYFFFIGITGIIELI